MTKCPIGTQVPNPQKNYTDIEKYRSIFIQKELGKVINVKFYMHLHHEINQFFRISVKYVFKRICCKDYLYFMIIE